MFLSRIKDTSDVQPNNNVYLVDIRVYVAGILVPVLSARVTSGIETPAEASFSMPPYPELMQVGRRDRVPVQIFYKDTLGGDDDVHLMFDGYIISVAYTSTAMSRAVTFTATAWINVVNNFQFLEVKELDGLFTSHTNATTEQGVNVNTALEPFFPRLVYTGLEKSNGNIKVPCEYLNNLFLLIERLGTTEDTTMTKFDKSVYAVYHKNLVTQMKMRQRICGVACFDNDSGATLLENANSPIKEGTSAVFPVLTGFIDKTALDHITNIVNNSMSQGYNILQIIQTLMSSLDYEYLNISTPAYHKYRVEPLGDGPEMATMCFKPNLASSPYVPMCNIIFRTEALSIGAQEVFENVPTRVRLKNTQGSEALIYGGNISNPLTDLALTALYPLAKHEEIEQAADAAEKKEGYKAFLASDGDRGKADFADDLLDSEKYTGPHVADFNLPSWFDNYKAGRVKDAPETDIQYTQSALYERFMRKQLIETIYNVRAIMVDCVFDPYVQPGFPGVVFDGGDTAMSFAGYVTSVAHDFSQGRAATSVTMSYARTLEEAASLEIPNPVESVYKITHTKEGFEKISYSILGEGVNTDKVDGADDDEGEGGDSATAKDAESTTTTETEKKDESKTSTKKKKQIETNPGCKAMHMKEIYKTYTPVNTLNKNTNPQHALPAAYQLQSRNVTTLKQYLDFYEIEVDKNDYITLPSGESVPAAYGCNWISNRKALNIHEALWNDDTKMDKDIMGIIQKEIAIPAKEDEEDEGEGGDSAKNKEEQQASETPSSDTASVDNKPVAKADGGTITESAQAKTQNDDDEKRTEEDERALYFKELYAGKTTNVRLLLRAIANVEFSRYAYARPSKTTTTTTTKTTTEETKEKTTTEETKTTTADATDVTLAKGGETA